MQSCLGPSYVETIIFYSMSLFESPNDAPPLITRLREPRSIGQRSYRSARLLVLGCAFLVGCVSPTPLPSLSRYEFKHPAMGTLFSLTLYASSETGAQEAANGAFRRIDALEDMMSDYQADSELMRLCDQPFGRPVPISPELFTV